MPPSAITVAGRTLGPGLPCFIIAEAGVNHNGSLELAIRLVDAAAEAGADAVKFQTFQADRLVTAQAPRAEYQRRNTGTGGSQLELLRALELGPETHRQLQAHCRSRGILFLSSPFGEASADLLEALDVPLFKVPSGELTNHPFLTHLARKGRPLILSTGMASLGEVESALGVIQAAGAPPVALLQCVSCYPASARDANLRAMDTLAAAFQVPVGYSDHTEGIAVSLAAVARGACILEKHITLDRRLPGPDQQVSIDPPELAALVAGIRTVEAALGDGRKRPAPAEQEAMAVARKSLVAAAALPAGTVLGPTHFAVKRPGTGLPPAMLTFLVGRRLRRAVAEGDLLALDDLD
jgi:N-acetylneuraminate synthase